ncbi:MAG: methylmalonyl-CoA epimerase [Bacteroidetes bacterium]|nr:methylmalonyl-CoA epimerase [Bacteroidota bacterium]
MSRFTLEHLGIAVTDASEAVALFERLLGAKPYKIEPVEHEGLQTYFIGDGGEVGASPKLELLEAIQPESPVAAFLEKRGPGLHHIAFEVDDIEAEMTRLASLGFRLLADEPKLGADGKRVVFIHPKSTGGVLVELCQSVEPTHLAVPFKDGKLAAFVSGPEDAPPLVVLHAALGSTEMETRRLTRIWEKDFRVYALDFMAHGRSDSFEGHALTLEVFADNVLALLDAIDVETTHVFGFSLGGGVVLFAAHKHPQRFDRLAIHAHNVQWIQSEADQMVGVMRSALAAPDSFWARRLAETHGTEHWQDLVRRMISFTEALPARQFDQDDLASIAHPTLVSTGDSDRFFPLRHSLMLYSTLPTASLAVLPGVDHPIRSVDPKAFASMIATHLLA